jgi:hypothetical protein
VDGGLGRRELLAVGSLGITSSLLPSGVAAASVGGVVAAAPSAPTIASAEPAGYLLSQPQVGTSTGAIEVAWGEVGGATSYAVSTRTPSGSGDYLLAGTTSATTLTVTGLSESATYDVVVEASNAVGASSPSAPATAVGTVVATGGTVTTFVGDGANGTSGTRYVVHAFTTVGASSLTLNRSRALEYLVVGGGGGGGGLTGRNMCAGGGGGGGVVVGDRASAGTAVGEPLAIVVGDGGAGGPDAVPDPLVSPGADGYARSGASSSFDGVTALGGGAGGSAPFSGSAAAGDAAALPAPNAVSTAARATGGGGLGQSTAQSGASGSASKGGDGTANINSVSSQFGGGGGGAGGDGTATTDATTSGRGGVGVASRIAGTRVEYGSGGGGGKRQDGSGGPGGALSGLVSAGGAGGRDAAGSAGVDGRGGGGGGAGRDSGTPVVGNAVGGRGGSGVVIVRYAVPA